MMTDCQTALTISGHDPPASTRSKRTRTAHGSNTRGLYPAKADNLSAPYSTYKGINHGKAT